MKLFIILLFLSFNINADPYKPLPTDFINNKNKVKKNKKSSSQKNKKNQYKEIIKDMNPTLGYFDFYENKNKNKVYLSIKPEQLNVEFLMGFTRQAGDGYQFDGSSMMGEGVYFFNRVGDIIQLVEKNTIDLRLGCQTRM